MLENLSTIFLKARVQWQSHSCVNEVKHPSSVFAHFWVWGCHLLIPILLQELYSLTWQWNWCYINNIKYFLIKISICKAYIVVTSNLCIPDSLDTKRGKNLIAWRSRNPNKLIGSHATFYALFGGCDSVGILIKSSNFKLAQQGKKVLKAN